ncbi:hypothetical protein JST97_15390 [bacterium]|nr:hypothetical protein [bacterium]
MSSITFSLPQGWTRTNCNSIDEALAAKRCKDLVKDVTTALENYSDTLVSYDNGESDYCPELNRVIALKVADRYRYCISDVDLSYSEDKSKLLRGEIRSTGEGYTAISKAEPASDGSTVFARSIEFTDSNGTQNHQDISVQMNADGTLSMLLDQGDVPAGMSTYVRSIHVQSGG